MPGRNYSSNGYRYGFNGKEKDDEIKGSSGSSYDYGMRMYDARLGRFMSVDPLAKSYPYWSPYAFAGNTPIQAIDLDGEEIYYAQSGQKLGVYGTSTEVRVVNDDQVKTTQAQFALYNEAVKTDPASTNEFLGTTLVNSGSVAYADYFTNVNDVVGVNDANFTFRSYKDFENNGGCFGATEQQLNDAGSYQTGPNDAIQTKVNAQAQTQWNKSTLTEDAIGGSIYIQTQLNKGNPVMVGVEVDYPNNMIGAPSTTYRNENTNTSHFVLINSSNVSNGNVSFGYIDNATSNKAKGTSSGNSFNLNTTTGGMQDNTSVITGSSPPAGQPASTGYQVTEVRKNQ